MTNKIGYLRKLIKEKGFFHFFVSILSRYLSWPQWVLFRLTQSSKMSSQGISENFSGRDKEGILMDIIRRNKGKSFLEIGIGFVPNIERAKLIVSQGIQYVGCDWKLACEKYRLKLKAEGIEDGFTFAPNERGNYNWTLFDMMRQNRIFDIIYLDGNHTFYIDFPAAVLSHHLLKKGGYLILDDITWSLEGLKQMLKNDFHGWYFYKTMYTFNEYTDEQMKEFHIQMIAEDYLIKKLGYRLAKELSNSSFWVLEKP